MKLFKQMIELNQTTFNNALDAMALLQNRFERVVTPAFDQTFGIPVEGRKAIERWAGFFRESRQCFKQQMNRSFEQADKLLLPRWSSPQKLDRFKC